MERNKEVLIGLALLDMAKKGIAIGAKEVSLLEIIYKDTTLHAPPLKVILPPFKNRKLFYAARKKLVEAGIIKKTGTRIYKRKEYDY